MKNLIAALAMAFFTAAPSTGLAERSGAMVASVYVVVSPNVSIAPIGSHISAGTVQQGLFSTDLTFRISANQDAIALAGAASPLFKGNDPASNEVAPIPLDLSRGIRIKPAKANPYSGKSNVVEFMTAVDIEGFPGMQTGYITFGSSQRGRFSQDVTLTVWWNQDDHDKPVGEYGGKVRLSALILPPPL